MREWLSMGLTGFQVRKFGEILRMIYDCLYSLEIEISNSGSNKSNLPGIVSFYETALGVPYALPKLDSIAVPSKGGAMENWGLITYCEYCLLVDQDQAAEADKSAMIDVNAHEIGEWIH